MKDGCGREVNYLRVSVTDRCDLRCVYCMPVEGVEARAHGDVLRYEEILRAVGIAAGLGINRVRVTGGEPLVRRGLVEFIGRLSALPGVEEVSLTTNGQRLAGAAQALKHAGLARVNISLDTLRPERFTAICRRGELAWTLAGMEAALAAGLHPVKLNMVVMRGVNDDEVADFAALTIKDPLHVRFIELMPLGQAGRCQEELFVSAADIRSRVAERYPLHAATGITGNGPARYFRIPSAAGTVGFIAPLSEHFCQACNRLRLSAAGGLSPCLGWSEEIDLGGPLRGGVADAELERLVRQAILMKPVRHDMARHPDAVRLRRMHKLGG
jgi:cyclic pyranopterin phosphate synthase